MIEEIVEDNVSVHLLRKTKKKLLLLEYNHEMAPTQASTSNVCPLVESVDNADKVGFLHCENEVPPSSSNAFSYLNLKTICSNKIVK